MKLVNPILFLVKLLLISLEVNNISAVSLSLKTHTKTKTQTEGKMSIFSYDLLSIMKKKMTMAEKKKEGTGMGIDPPKSGSNNSNTSNTVVKDSQTKIHPVKPHIQSKVNPAQNSHAANSDQPPSFKGWVKYFKFNDAKGKPTAFFKNNEFHEQMKAAEFDIEKRTEDGMSLYVPDEAYWWVTLSNNNIVIASSRINGSKKVFENLSLNLLQPVVETNGYKGGILDFGAFSEGACFKLMTTDRLTWMFCTEDATDKEDFMKAIKDTKLQLQRQKGEIVTIKAKPKEESIDSIINPQKPKSEVDSLTQPLNIKGKPRDGYWVVLQNWSQCTKLCDSGISTLQRRCIKPKRGGRPCEGEAILTKACNTQPCPPVEEDENDADHTGKKKLNSTEEAMKPVTLKPIFKSMPISAKPTRFHMCILKEDDLILRQLSENKVYTLLPVRAVMNNRTISLYENEDDPSAHFTTYNLKTANLIRSKRDKACFIISESKRSSELCPVGADEKFETFNEWAKDFKLFKFNCETKPNEIEIELNNRMKNKMDEAKREMLTEREELVKKRLQKKEEDTGHSIIKKTNRVAQEAIIKEETLEEMIEKEEEEREQLEEINIKKQIEAEKKKNECILKAIKEKQVENQYKMKNQETEKEVDDIKREAMKEVMEKRMKLKQKIAEMRKKANRKSQALKSKLLNMKFEMAQEMNDAYKQGDQEKCSQALKDDQSRKNYCTANFTDMLKFSQCRDNDDFCTLCCENEFGEMHVNKRNACLKTLCDPLVNKPTGTKGRWMWHEGMK